MSISSVIFTNQPSIVENVPTEIWTEIFQNVHHSTGTKSTRPERELTRRSILSASQTCTLWRDITIRSPYLWTTILVDFEASTPSNNLYLTNLWLSRSQNSPLSISLFHIPDVEEEPSQSRECLVAVFTHITRWKDALMSWKSSTFDIWSSVDSFMDHAPLLESLVMEMKCDDNINGRELVPWKIWLDAPCLRKLVVVVVLDDGYQVPLRVRYTSWTSHFHIPYRRLTHLRLELDPNEVVRYCQVVSIFKCAPNLIACFIEGIDASVSAPTFNPNDRNVLQHLQHLYLAIRTQVTPSLPGLLEYITASSLVTLTVVGDINFRFESYKSFILRSSCAIEELNLVKTHLPIGHTFPTLELSPSLRAVNFDTFLINHPRLERWTSWDVREDRFQLCPNLERLSISGYACLGLTWPPEASGSSTITRALAARIRPPTGVLRTFTLLIPSSDDKYVPQELRALCDEPSGLTIGFNDDVLKMGVLWNLHADR